MNPLILCFFVLLNLWAVGYGVNVRLTFTSPTKDSESALQKLQSKIDEVGAEMNFVCGHMSCAVEQVDLLLQNKHHRAVALLRVENEAMAAAGLQKFVSRMLEALQETSEELQSHMRGNSQLFFMKFFGRVQKKLFLTDSLVAEQCRKESQNKKLGAGDSQGTYPVTLEKNRENNEEAVSSEMAREDGELTPEKVDQILDEVLSVQLHGTCEKPEKSKINHSFKFSVSFNNCSFSASTQMNEFFSKTSNEAKEAKEFKPLQGQTNMFPSQLMEQLRQMQKLLQPLMSDDRVISPLFGRISLLLETEPSDKEAESGESSKGGEEAAEGGAEAEGVEQAIDLSSMYPLEEESALDSLSSLFEDALREVGTIMQKKPEGDGSSQEQGAGDIKLTSPLDPNSEKFQNLVGQIVGSITSDTEEGSELAEEVKKQVEKVIKQNMGNIGMMERALKNELGQELSDVLNLEVLKEWEHKLKELEEEEKKGGASKKPIASYDITLE